MQCSKRLPHPVSGDKYPPTRFLGTSNQGFNELEPRGRPQIFLTIELTRKYFPIRDLERYKCGPSAAQFTFRAAIPPGDPEWPGIRGESLRIEPLCRKRRKLPENCGEVFPTCFQGFAGELGMRRLDFAEVTDTATQLNPCTSRL